MREWFFRKALQALEKHTPGIVIRAELQILLNTTARGFGVPGKQIWQYSAGKALEEYARFTSDCLHNKRDAGNAESALNGHHSEMSCVDSGIISGLCGGGRLTFTKRITEGCTLCTAYFKRK